MKRVIDESSLEMMQNNWLLGSFVYQSLSPQIKLIEAKFKRYDDDETPRTSYLCPEEPLTSGRCEQWKA